MSRNLNRRRRRSARARAESCFRNEYLAWTAHIPEPWLPPDEIILGQRGNTNFHSVVHGRPYISVVTNLRRDSVQRASLTVLGRRARRDVRRYPLQQVLAAARLALELASTAPEHYIEAIIEWATACFGSFADHEEPAAPFRDRSPLRDLNPRIASEDEGVPHISDGQWLYTLERTTVEGQHNVPSRYTPVQSCSDDSDDWGLDED